MTPSPDTALVGVALIENADRELLWVWDDVYGCFALPMSRVRVGESALERPDEAAARAAARALGVPVVLGKSVALTPQHFVSGRDQAWRTYRYHVFKAHAHADFTPSIAGPHLWLPPHRSARSEYRPFSASGRWVVAALTANGLLPGRSQFTAAVLLRRKHLDKWQFLLRLEPGWGYSLPTKRRAADEPYTTAAERVLTAELGLKADAVPLNPATESVVTERAKSVVEQADTFYCHGVFTADVPADLPVKSDRPLVWADAAAIASGWLSDRTDTTGQKAPGADVSPTALRILMELEVIPTVGEQ